MVNRRFRVKRPEDKDTEVRLIVSGGIPDIPIPEGPAAYMQHAPTPEIAQVMEERDKALSDFESAYQALTKAQQSLDAINARLIILEQAYAAELTAQSPWNI